jgi:hypothetical protein
VPLPRLTFVKRKPFENGSITVDPGAPEAARPVSSGARLGCPMLGTGPRGIIVSSYGDVVLPCPQGSHSGAPDTPMQMVELGKASTSMGNLQARINGEGQRVRLEWRIPRWYESLPARVPCDLSMSEAGGAAGRPEAADPGLPVDPPGSNMRLSTQRRLGKGGSRLGGTVKRQLSGSFRGQNWGVAGQAPPRQIA